MEFRGKEPIRTKVVVNDQIVEQESHFYYLKNKIGYDKNFDIDAKLGNIQTLAEVLSTQSTVFLKTRYIEKTIEVFTKVWQSLYCAMCENCGQQPTNI